MISFSAAEPPGIGLQAVEITPADPLFKKFRSQIHPFIANSLTVALLFVATYLRVSGLSRSLPEDRTRSNEQAGGRSAPANGVPRQYPECCRSRRAATTGLLESLSRQQARDVGIGYSGGGPTSLALRVTKGSIDFVVQSNQN